MGMSTEDDDLLDPRAVKVMEEQDNTDKDAEPSSSPKAERVIEQKALDDFRLVEKEQRRPTRQTNSRHKITHKIKSINNLNKNNNDNNSNTSNPISVSASHDLSKGNLVVKLDDPEVTLILRNR